MAKRSDRRWLLKSLQRLFATALEQRGFRLVPLTADEARSERGQSHPLGRFHRIRGDGGLDIIEIDMRRDGAPAFRIHAGVAPKGGMTTVNGTHIIQEDLWTTWLEEFYEVAPWGWLKTAYFQKYFKLIRRAWDRSVATEGDYDTLVLGVVNTIPQIEKALRDGKCGPNIRYVNARECL